jgi:hypothetical protein
VGSYNRLLSREPMLSPLLWTSIATGRKPQDHGVLDFAEVYLYRHHCRKITRACRYAFVGRPLSSWATLLRSRGVEMSANGKSRKFLPADASGAREGETLRQGEWRAELLKTGVRGKNNQILTFARVVKAEIDQEKIEAYRGTVSLPFEPGRRIPVKIVDDRGIESLKVIEVRT